MANSRNQRRLSALERRGQPDAAEEAEKRILLDALDWFEAEHGSLAGWNLMEALQAASERVPPGAYQTESARIIVDYIEDAGRKNPDAEAAFWRLLDIEKGGARRSSSALPGLDHQDTTRRDRGTA